MCNRANRVCCSRCTSSYEPVGPTDFAGERFMIRTEQYSIGPDLYDTNVVRSVGPTDLTDARFIFRTEQHNTGTYPSNTNVYN